jgi:hypothetical protein
MILHLFDQFILLEDIYTPILINTHLKAFINFKKASLFTYRALKVFCEVGKVFLSQGWKQALKQIFSLLEVISSEDDVVYYKNRW